MSHHACLQKPLTKIPRNSCSWRREQCEGRDLLPHKGVKWPRGFLVASGMDSLLTASMNFKFNPHLGAGCCLSQLSRCRLILKISFSLITDHLQINYTVICCVPQVYSFPCHRLRKLVQELWGEKRRKRKAQGENREKASSTAMILFMVFWFKGQHHQISSLDEKISHEAAYQNGWQTKSAIGNKTYCPDILGNKQRPGELKFDKTEQKHRISLRV